MRRRSRSVDDSDENDGRRESIAKRSYQNRLKINREESEKDLRVARRRSRSSFLTRQREEEEISSASFLYLLHRSFPPFNCI